MHECIRSNDRYFDHSRVNRPGGFVMTYVLSTVILSNVMGGRGGAESSFIIFKPL